RVEAVGSDPRAPGPIPDPGRARGARQGRIRPHPDRAAQRAGEAVHGADGNRRDPADVHRRGHRSHCRLRDDRERSDRKHRRPPSPYGDGEAARRDLVRGTGPAEQNRHDRRRLRHPDAGGGRQERGSVAVYPVRRFRTTTQNPQRTHRSAWSAVSVLIVAAIAASACGKSGPPLPPLVKLPVAPGELVAERRGETVDIHFVVPAANTDGTRPANIQRVEVYAITGAPATMPDAQLLKRGVKVASVDVKAPKDPDAA